MILKIYILLIMLLQLSHFPLFIPLHPAHPLLPTSHLFSSCPWAIRISSLASTFPILFLTSPCVFSMYYLSYLFSVPFPPLSPSHSPVDNSLRNGAKDLHFCDSVPILVVCLVCFCFLDLVDSYEFVVFFFKILFIIREGKGERKKHQCVVASQAPPH